MNKDIVMNYVHKPEFMKKFECNCTNRSDVNCQNYCPFECDSVSYSTGALSYLFHVL